MMAPYLEHVILPVWGTLTAAAKKYVTEVVNQSGEDDDELVDSDGEVLGFENLVHAIFEIVHILMESPKYRPAVRKGLSDIMYYVVLYMQITEEQIEKWTDNPNQYVEDEDEDTFTFNVRIASQDLLEALCEEFEEECCVALAQTLERHLAEAEQMKQSGNPHWWKLHEATMLALGSTQEVIERQLAAGRVKFDLAVFLQNVVLSNIASPASPFLFGRCLWIGSKFPAHLPDEALPQFLEATVRGLQQDQIITVRISAVRAIRGFCEHLRSPAPPPLPPAAASPGAAAEGSPEHQQQQQQMRRSSSAEYRAGLLTPVLPAALDALIGMSATFSHSSDMLGLCDPTFTAEHESKITPLSIAILLKYNSDPVLVSLVQDVIRVLSQIEGCRQPLQQRAVPTIVSILDAHEEKVALGLKAVALDVLEILVRGSAQTKVSNTPASPLQNGHRQQQQESPSPTRLSDLLMTSAFPAAVRCTLSSDDNAIMQSGGECLRSYVSVAPDQICHFVDAEGKSGLWYLVQVAGHLLNPVGNEYSATFVGRLVTTLIRKTGDRLGENLENLLKAVLSKLSGTKTLSVAQSLLMVFAQLVHNQMEALLNFLTAVPGPNGEAALEFVLSKWVQRHHVFYGAYENKVSIVALAKLLQHGVNTNDSRLQGINVAGDMIVKPGANKIRTRSQKKDQTVEYTSIPVLVKIFKLIVQEMNDMLKEALASARVDGEDDDEEEEEDTDEEGDEWEDEGIADESTQQEKSKKQQEKNSRLGVELSKILSEPGYAVEEEEEEEDPDVLSDPVYSLNLRQYLSRFLLEFCKQPYFPHFAEHLNQAERRHLAALGAPV